jgi:HPt (histidine-containing phosphotransfer) domain-containing protein
MTGRTHDDAISTMPAEDQDLLPEYVDSLRETLERAMDCLFGGDFDEIRRLGHCLKGSGPIYGFARVGALGASMEHAARSGDGSAILSSLDELGGILSRAPYGRRRMAATG